MDFVPMRVLSVMRSPVFFLFSGVVLGLMGAHAWADGLMSWVFVGCAGGMSTVLLLKGRNRSAVSIGGLSWGSVVSCSLLLCKAARDPSPLQFNVHCVAGLDVVTALVPRGTSNRVIARDMQGLHWILEGTGQIRPGDCAMVLCRRRMPSKPAHPWDFNESHFLEGKGLEGILVIDQVLHAHRANTTRGQMLHVLDRCRRRARGRLLGLGRSRPQGAALLLGLTTGDRTGMSRTVRSAFAGLGLAHLTAVSGFHVGLVMGMMSLLIRLAGAGRRWVGVLSLPAVWTYVLACGSTSSALRAAGMATMASVVIALGRRPDGVMVLSMVGLVLLAGHPGLVLDLGTRLSFLATFGILLWFQTRRVGPSPFSSMLAIPVVATAFTAPVILPVFARFPIAFLPANLLATPCVPVLSMLAFLLILLPAEAAAVLSPAILWLAEGVTQVAVLAHALVPELRLTVDSGCLVLSGVSLAFFCLLGILRGSPMVHGALAVIMAGMMLRFGMMQASHWRAHVLPHGDVVVHAAGRAVAFRVDVDREDLEWKTRTLMERVSKGPPLPVNRSVDGRVAWSDLALMAMSPRDAVVWVSSPRSHYGSPGPHMLPRPPCP